MTNPFLSLKMRLAYTLFILMGAAFCLAGCSEDNPYEPDKPVGPGGEDSLVSTIVFEGSKLEDSPVLDEDEVICWFKMEESNSEPFSIKGNCYEDRGNQVISLYENLPVGNMRITHIQYRFARDKPDVLSSYGLGYLLHIKKNGRNTQVTVDGQFDEDTRFVGKGTAEEPYYINCGEDLMHLQGLVNKDNTGTLFKDTHFRQTTDIDMGFVCRYLNGEYGWLPIGYKNNFPFRGYYHGGNNRITNMWIKRSSIGGLFGCLYGALVDSIHFSGIDIKMEAIAGVVAGAIIAAGSDNTPGDTIINSQIRGCTVKKSQIDCPVGAGMLVGMVDANARLTMEECGSDNTNRIINKDECYGIGGYIGLAAFTSNVYLSDLHNTIDLSSTMGGVGGIIGTSDTLTAINCANQGAITLMATDGKEKNGVGGISGGTGCAQFINCINTGTIRGSRGTGGILGSALIDAGDGTLDDPGLYNNALFITCMNKGDITGSQYAGGICGEAQACVISSANSGKVETTGGYAAGIVGAAPAAALYDCLNTGDIKADKILGGINGFSITSTATMCLNFG